VRMKGIITEMRAFRTTDGEIFEDIEDAKKRQTLIDLKNWYETHELYSNYGSTVNFGSLRDWLFENKEFLMESMRILMEENTQ
jgi:hypothetical protein